MSKVATKLFRDIEEAKQAIKELKAMGFKPGEIRVLANEKRGKDLGTPFTSDVAVLAGSGVPAETINYYKFSIQSGSIVVSAQGDENRIARAQALLRAIPVCSCVEGECGTSPGFQAANRMSSTNPMDASMSGEFRKY